MSSPNTIPAGFARECEYYNEQFVQVLLPREQFPPRSTVVVSATQNATGNVVAEVAAERERQDGKWGGPSHDDMHPVEYWVQLIQDYAAWARVMAGMGSRDKARRRLIQVAALAVAAVEKIDRAPKPDGAR